MNSFIQYIPTFVEGSVGIKFDFTGTGHLLEQLDEYFPRSARFHQYSISGDMIMQELDEGKVWWVLGRVVSPKGVDLPKWVAKY